MSAKALGHGAQPKEQKDAGPSEQRVGQIRERTRAALTPRKVVPWKAVSRGPRKKAFGKIDCWIRGHQAEETALQS